MGYIIAKTSHIDAIIASAIWAYAGLEISNTYDISKSKMFSDPK